MTQETTGRTGRLKLFLTTFGLAAILGVSGGLMYLTWPAPANADDAPVSEKVAPVGEPAPIESPVSEPAADATTTLKGDWCHLTDDDVSCLQKAEASGKRIIFLFSADWCGWCKHFKTKVEPDPEVQKLLGEFFLVYVDSEKGKKFTEKAGVKGFPFFLVFEKAFEKVIGAVGGTPRTPDAFIKQFSQYRAS